MATYRSGFVKQGSRSYFFVEDADTKQKNPLRRSRHHLMLLLMPPSPFLTVSKKSQGTNLPWLFFSYANSSFLSGMEGFFTSPSPSNPNLSGSKSAKPTPNTISLTMERIVDSSAFPIA